MVLHRTWEVNIGDGRIVRNRVRAGVRVRALYIVVFAARLRGTCIL